MCRRSLEVLGSEELVDGSNNSEGWVTKYSIGLGEKSKRSGLVKLSHLRYDMAA